MSLVFNSKIKDSKPRNEQRAMESQWNELCELRANSEKDVKQLLKVTVNHGLVHDDNLDTPVIVNELGEVIGNQGVSPADAYREFDTTSKIDMVPAGEFATLTRLMQKARSVSIGREVFEYRKVSTAGVGQTSMSGQIGIKQDHVDFKYAGTVVPVHDTAWKRRWREMESMRAEGYDVMVDESRESERTLMETINRYMWDGDAGLVVKGHAWLGIKTDPTVAQYTLQADLSADATTPTAIRDEVRAARDVLYINNNCTKGLRLGVSREIMSNWERVYSTSEGIFGTIEDMVKRLRGISEVYEDSELVGNQIVMYWDDQQGFHPVVGMGISSYAVPRVYHNDDFQFIKWAAVGFLAKNDYENRTCALYGSE